MGLYRSHVEADGRRHNRAAGTPPPQYPGNCIGCKNPFAAGAHLIHEDGHPETKEHNGLWHEACHTKAFGGKAAFPPEVQTSAPA
jgi:hypothetical protein